jgi:hypothetical protein
MSSLDTSPIVDPMVAADYLYDLLREFGPTFGLENVEYDSRLVRAYPAAVIIPGRKDKVLHSTQFFRVGLEVLISVYHANLNNSHRERTRDDLQLCKDIEMAIEVGQLDWDERVTFAFVSEIAPGIITRPRGEQVVGTRMVVSIDSRELMSKGA